MTRSPDGNEIDERSMVNLVEERLRERFTQPQPENPDSPQQQNFGCEVSGSKVMAPSAKKPDEVATNKVLPETMAGALKSESLSPKTPKTTNAAKGCAEDLECGLAPHETRETSRSRFALYVVLAVLAACAGTALIFLEHERMAKLNPSLLASITAPLLAQLCKPFTHYLEHGVWMPSRALGSGGMPSGHAAAVVSLATCSGIRAGWDSNEFAIAATLMMIVLYDACHVRLESEHHAVILNEMMQHLSEQHPVRRVTQKECGATGFLKTKIGHYKRELAGGSIVGVCAGLLFSTIK